MQRGCWGYFTLCCPQRILTQQRFASQITILHADIHIYACSRQFFDFFSPRFLFYFRALSGRVPTSSRGSNFQGLKGHLKVSCGRSGTSRRLQQGTASVSTLMESCMDMSSGMVVLVMCRWKGTAYGVWGSRVPPLPGTPHPQAAQGTAGRRDCCMAAAAARKMACL